MCQENNIPKLKQIHHLYLQYNEENSRPSWIQDHKCWTTNKIILRVMQLRIITGLILSHTDTYTMLGTNIFCLQFQWNCKQKVEFWVIHRAHNTLQAGPERNITMHCTSVKSRSSMRWHYFDSQTLPSLHYCSFRTK